MKTTKFVYWFILSYCLIFHNAMAGNLMITLYANEYQISQVGNGFSEIIMDDFGATITPGQPQLPAKTFMIALPPGAQVQQVNFHEAPAAQFEGLYKIKPVQPMIRSSASRRGATRA